MKDTFAKSRKMSSRNDNQNPTQNIEKKNVNIHYEKQNHIFEKSVLPSRTIYFSRVTIIEHVFAKKNIDEITILHYNLVCFQVFSESPYVSRILFSKHLQETIRNTIVKCFLCKITIYNLNLDNKIC